MDSKAVRLTHDITKEKNVRAGFEKEEKLRLKWFMANEEKLNEAVNAPLQRQVSEEAKKELQEHRQRFQAHKEKFVRTTGQDGPEPPMIDPDALKHVMRPVDPETLRLLYTGERDSRKTYLKERVNLIPEQRYYCAETTNFLYGWNMWDHVKTRPNYGFGRTQIIKSSFYRRRGTERDPDWYTEPARLSPTICLYN